MSKTNTATLPLATQDQPASWTDEMIKQCEKMMRQYWADNPDLYHLVQLKNQKSTAANTPGQPAENSAQSNAASPTIITETDNTVRLANNTLRGSSLLSRIRENQQQIRQRVLAMNADIVLRTQACNRKCAYHSLAEARDFHADILASQIKSWRKWLPNLIRRFSQISDYRRTKSIKHKLAVLMMFGLFAFIFRLTSRREMNRELTGPVIFNNLKKCFPEIDSIPHADNSKSADAY